MATKYILAIICLSLAPACLGLTYQTSLVRTDTVNSLCASFSSRSQLVSSDNAAQVQQYNTVMKASFSFRGADLFKTVITTMMGGMSGGSMDPSSILTAYPNLPKEYGLFVGPFLLGMIVLVMTCFCSCCCCCCPAACPPCGCCKKPMKETYTRCELIWPGIVLMIALALILAAGAIGLTKSKDLQNTIESVGCSVSICLDDLINGNVTDSNKYFIGLKPLYNSISMIKNNLTNIDTQFTSIVPTGPAAVATATAFAMAQGAIDLIPNNAAGTRVPAYFYNTPFDNAAATATLASNLPGALGSTAAADSATAIYGSYNGLGIIQNVINQITFGALGVKTQIAGTFGSALDSAKGIIKGVLDNLVNGDIKYFTIYSSVTPYFPVMGQAVTGIYAGFVALASIAMLATLMLLICNIYKCRYILYLTCLIFVIIGVISFLLSVMISALIPITYWTCDFATFTFSSKANFDSMFSVLPAQYANMTSVVTTCLKGQSGDLLQSNVFGNAAASISGLKGVLDNLNSFDSVAINSNVDTAWGITKDLITDYYAGKTLDFSSASDQAVLERLSDRTNYGCTAPNFATDSWIPTTMSSPTITCKTPGHSAVATSCPAVIDWTGGSAGGTMNCYGCMDAQQLLAIYGAAAFFVGNFQARYNNGDCMTFITDFQNTNANYYAIKATTYGPIATRAGTADAAVGNYKTQITALGGQFNTVKAGLQSTANAIVDPTYGILAGLNCGIVGEDILLVLNTACTNGFQLMFFIRAAFGIAAFGILVTMWCASCTGVRHYKQMQALSASHNSQPKQKDITNTTLQDINPANRRNQTQFLPPQNVTYY